MPLEINNCSYKSVMSSNLIVVEGFDGTGKTTLCSNLGKIWNQWSNTQPSYYREPGSTKFSEQLRELMFSYNDLDSNLLTLLMTSSRYELMRSVVNNDLHLKPVILDRFVYSTLAYQGGDNPLLISMIVSLHNMFIRVLPKVVIFCHAKHEDITKRILERGEGNCFDELFIERVDSMQNRYWKALHETELHDVVKPNIISVNTSEFEPELLANLVSGVLKDFRSPGKMGLEFSLGTPFKPIF